MKGLARLTSVPFINWFASMLELDLHKHCKCCLNFISWNWISDLPAIVICYSLQVWHPESESFNGDAQRNQRNPGTVFHGKFLQIYLPIWCQFRRETCMNRSTVSLLLIAYFVPVRDKVLPFATTNMAINKWCRNVFDSRKKKKKNMTEAKTSEGILFDLQE